MRDLFRVLWNYFKVISSRHNIFTNYFLFRSFIVTHFYWIEDCLQPNLRSKIHKWETQLTKTRNLCLQFASNSFWFALYDREQGECAAIRQCQRFSWNIKRRRWWQWFQRRADTVSWRSARHRPCRQDCTKGKFVAETCASTRPTRADKPKYSEATGRKRPGRDKGSDWGPIDP